MKQTTGLQKGSHGQGVRGVNSEDKRQRNRISQKAFRARQIMKIKELESRLEARPSTEPRVTQLEERNTFLCSQLFENHKKMMSLHFTLKKLIESSADILDQVVSYISCELWPRHFYSPISA